MVQWSAEPVGRAKRLHSRKDKTLVPPPNLPPAKRRIAEALAALLLADYRRQQERPDPRHGPRP
jgi:hypothetical protein